MAASKQTHKDFAGRGQLLQDHRPPIPVCYYLLLSMRPALKRAHGGAQPIEWVEWEWDQAQGFLTLCDEEDARQLDVHTDCTLVLDDGTCCIPILVQDSRRPRIKYRVQFPARELAAPTAPTAA